MATEHMTDTEMTTDFDAVLEKLRNGVDVIVDRNQRPVVVITPAPSPGHKISECIVLAKAHEDKLGYRPIPDPDFMKDAEDGIASHRDRLIHAHRISPQFQRADHRRAKGYAGQRLLLAIEENTARQKSSAWSRWSKAFTAPRRRKLPSAAETT